MNNSTKNSVSLHPRRQYRDVSAALAMYTTTQDMAAQHATATPPTEMNLAIHPSSMLGAPARAPRYSLRSLRDVELAIANIQWPLGHPMSRARSRSRSYSVTVHLSPAELRAAAHWDRIIGVVSTLTIVAILAKLCL